MSGEVQLVFIPKKLSRSVCLLISHPTPVKSRLDVSSTSPFLRAALFDITCKQHYTTAFNPFLIGTKNGDIDGTCKTKPEYLFYFCGE